MSVPMPSGPERRQPSFWLGLVIGVLVMLVAVLGYALVTSKRDVATPTGSSTPSPSASLTPSPTPKPRPDKPAAVVEALFNDNNVWTEGERLSFGVAFLDVPDDDCATHTYTMSGKQRGAFRSDCRSWEPEYDILLFRLSFENTSDRATSLILRSLVLTDRYGNTYGPVNVRSHAEYPPYFLNEKQQLPPGGEWSGWVTFDGRVVSLVPRKLSYIDGNQTLVQVFSGKHAVVQPVG